tara:strand:- start:214 stop:417 length:204 start_codon:yes stop_codon:yes gene_type:complete
MKTFEIGDLIRLSLRGRLSVGEINITDKIGIVLCNDTLYDDLIFVKWLTTGIKSEVHVDFVERLEEK